MTEAVIELSTSDIYHRYKRNLLFFASVTFVLICSKHKDGLWKIPGIDAEVSAVWAYLFLLMAVLYAGAQYVTEFLAVRARNAEGWAEVKAGRLDQALEVQADRVGRQNGRIDYLMKRLDEHFTGFVNVTEQAGVAIRSAVSEIEALKYNADFSAAISSAPENTSLAETFSDALRRQQNMKEMRTIVEKIESQAQHVKTAASEAAMELGAIGKESADLRAKFRRLSHFIHSGQRWGMTLLDGAVPGAMAVGAILLCLVNIIALTRS
jgi:hypothetical protein